MQPVIDGHQLKSELLLPVVSVGEAANTESADASSAVEAASAHKDTGSVSLMNRLVGGVSNRSVDVHDRQV